MNTYGYVGGNPLRWIDPYGLWTLGLSFNVSGGAGFGGTAGLNFVIGYGENGFSADIQRIIGGGSYIGASGGFTIGLEASNADSVSDLCGFGYQIGGSAGEALYGEASIFGGPGPNIGEESYQGISLGVGIGGGTPAAGFGYTTHTSSVLN